MIKTVPSPEPMTMIGNMGLVHGEGDAIPVSLEGLDASFRKVVPDCVVASGNHVEKPSWDE